MTIPVVAVLNRSPVITVTEGNVLQLGRECGVTAMIGPVGIQHANLGNGRVSLLIVREIILNEFEILEGHRQVEGLIEILQRVLVHLDKSVKYLHICRLFKAHHEGFRLLGGTFTGINRIDAVALDHLHVLVAHISVNDISGGSADNRLLIALQELYTLHGGICSLVELAGKVFHGEYMGVLRLRKILLVQSINRRLGKYDMACLLEYLVADVLDIIPDKDSDIVHTGNAHIMTDLVA